MKIRTSDKFIAWLTLFSGLSISAVAVYYSVAGLVSIFAAAVVPIMVMGVTLELSKLVATVWLKMNWSRAPILLRTYLLIAIMILMAITSMGIFGYLSKAHLDQAVPTGDVAAKVQMLDDKIKTEQDNIVAAKAALQQMDNQVNERLSRSTDDRGAERAVQIRKNQAKERKSLQNDIAVAQKEITKLREERAPIASELRKVEAEVGPIKYIAALIYGDNPDQNLLERAVRWVIIIIVAVFDPLAVIMLLASQYSFQWFRRQEDEEEQRKGWHQEWVPDAEDPWHDEPKYELDDGPLTEEQIDTVQKSAGIKLSDIVSKSTLFDEDPAIKSFFEKGKHLAKTIDENNGVLPVEEEHKDGLIQHHTNLDTINNVDVKPANKDFDPKEYYEYIDETGTYEPRNNKIEDIPVLEGEEMWAQEAIDASDDEDQEIIDSAIETEKAAMHAWKADNPDSSLKHQRKLLALGRIDHLPWMDYLKPQPDEGYIQNAEQNEGTIWQRVKNAKGNE